MRAAEEAAFARGVEVEALMDKAGAGVAQAVTRFFGKPGKCIVFAGKGNNAGDALVAAERFPALTRVVGIDIRTEPFTVARILAEERHLANVRFDQADLLAGDLSAFGHFDTVTVLHVLEHFTEADMYHVLKNLLALTSRRLIIGVPYEQEPESAYGHEQLFTRTKLEAVGNWCLEQLGGGQARCEDCAGGLLYLDPYEHKSHKYLR